jgi:hypothetical protein
MERIEYMKFFFTFIFWMAIAYVAFKGLTALVDDLGVSESILPSDPPAPELPAVIIGPDGTGSATGITRMATDAEVAAATEVAPE